MFEFHYCFLHWKYFWKTFSFCVVIVISPSFSLIKRASEKIPSNGETHIPFRQKFAFTRWNRNSRGSPQDDEFPTRPGASARRHVGFVSRRKVLALASPFSFRGLETVIPSAPVGPGRAIAQEVPSRISVQWDKNVSWRPRKMTSATRAPTWASAPHEYSRRGTERDKRLSTRDESGDRRADRERRTESK